MNLPELLGFYMTEKNMDDITLARKCNISPMNIVNIKKGSHTYCIRRRKNRICTEFRPHLAAQITAPKRRKTAVFHTATNLSQCGKLFGSIGFQHITRISE